MADLKQLALAGTSLDVPTSLNDLSDVSASAPVVGQVLTFENGAWLPRANQAAGFPGLDALDWKNPLELGFTKGDLPILAANTGTFEIAKFQNQAFLRVMSVAVFGNVTPGHWKSIFTNVPAAWLPKKGNALSVMQTWGPSVGGSVVAICAGNDPSVIWMIPLVWNSGQNYLHGIVSWYVE